MTSQTEARSSRGGLAFAGDRRRAAADRDGLTGLAYLPFAIGLGSGVAGPWLQARTSTRNTLAAGLIVAAVAMGWFSLLTPDQNPLAVLLGLAILASVAATAAQPGPSSPRCSSSGHARVVR
ncbi:hypothetical protein ACFVYA_47575 [Amycolatopsis sp. NPDC058278]|uniref:hypothetical protein n=1 Tax=Amycolatopsis sp. NPDC058278 TaxID=3346417 RepID=UPI0036DF0DA1